MPIATPAIGDPTKQSTASDIIDALAALEIDIQAVLGERMVTNGSFEIDTDSSGVPDGWERTLYTGGAFAITTDTGSGANSAHGEKAIKFTHPGGALQGGGEIVSESFIEINPNRPYWLTWLNKNSVAGVTNSVEILEFDATQSSLVTTQIFTANSNPTSWKMFKVGFHVANAATRYIKIKFKCGETSASTAGVIYLDNVQLQMMAAQRTIFETVGTWKWVCPPHVRYIELELIGGGGGGGGCNGGGTGGGGGGGGAYLYAQIAVTPGTSYDFVIGDKGAGGTSGTSGVGTSGSSTTFNDGTTTYTAAGGTEGTRGSSGGAGGAGGAATNGDVNTSGVAGGNGTGAPAAGSGGYAAPFSAHAPTNSAGGAGSNGPVYGAGGSGGRTGTTSGGDGASGVMIIRW